LKTANMTPESRSREKRHRAAAAAVLIAATAAVIYLNTLSNGFALDDIPIVRDNAEIRSLALIPRLFARPYWPQDGAASGLYRPVTVASLAFNWAATGAGPRGFHLGNVLLHVVVSALAWLAARRMGLGSVGALVAGLLFAVHPIHTEAVANVVGRAEILAAAGVLASWLAHCRALGSAGASATGWVVWAAVAYLLASLSKEAAIAAPLLFVLGDVMLDHRDTRAPKPRVALYCAYVAAAAASIALRTHALGGIRGAEDVAFIDNPPATMGPTVRIMTALWVLLRYAWLVVWPGRLCSDYSYDAIPAVTSPLDPRFAAGLVGALGLVAVLVWAARRRSSAVLGLGAWLVFLLPVSNLIFPIGTIMAERVAYLPSFGAMMVVGWLVERVRARRALLVAFFTAVVVALGARAVSRNAAWSDNLTLALNDARIQPRSAKLHAGAAISLHEAGRTAEAEIHYREALAIYPEYAQMHHNYAVLLASRGERAAAIDHLQRAAAIAPANPRPVKMLADLFEREGSVDKALRAYEEAMRIDASDLSLRFNYGRALLAAGRLGEGEQELSRLAAEHPGNVQGELATAVLHETRGELAEADATYRRLLERRDLPAAVRARVEASRAALATRTGATGSRQ
jgi:Flp pilus assembly protein TadD